MLGREGYNVVNQHEPQIAIGLAGKREDVGGELLGFKLWHP